MTRRLLRLLGLLAVLTMVAAACAGDGETDTAASEAVDAAAWPHTFVADQIGGGQLDANDLAGQDVILWFWAPW